VQKSSRHKDMLITYYAFGEKEQISE